MTRLILVTDSSAAGALQKARVGDLVIAIERRLVSGALPSAAQLEAFFAARTTQEPGLHWLDDTPAWRLEGSGAENVGLVDLFARCSSVELWFDPVPNAQLMLLWLLDYWRANAAAAPMLVMRCADTPIGNCEPQRLRKLDLPAVEVSPDHANAAHLAWQAYRSPTPGAWFDLLNADLSLLPQLVPCVVELLEELPAVAAGLGATEMRMLELIAPGDVQPSDLFPGHDKPNQRRVFSYWEVGSLLEELARSPVPAVSGLEEGPFSLEMHADSSRHERYRKSRLSLTEFGKAVLMKQEDFRRHNPIQRWWGGTELISERLWRWDAQSRSPIAP